MNYSKVRIRRGHIDVDLNTVKMIVGGVVVLIWLLCWFFGSAKFFGNLCYVVFHNIGFWVMFLVAVGFGLYRKITNPKEFTWGELPIQLGVTSLSLLLLFCIFFKTSSNLADVEIWNGYVTQAEYYEAWTEKTVTRDDKGNESVSYTYHPEEWKLITTAGDVDCSKDVYYTYKNKFGREQKEYIIRPSQSSIGDGNMYFVQCDRDSRDWIPASRPHNFVNYLRASDSIRKVRGNVDKYAQFIVPYPTVHDGRYGEIEFDRVVAAGVNVPSNWKSWVDERLDKELRTLGKSKEVNIVVYVVGAPSRDAAAAIREAWVQGKKNDVIVVVGAPQFPNVSWVEIIAWTKVEEFSITLRNTLTEMKNISDTEKFTQAITQQIAKPGDKGGFVRTPMSDYEYLISEISLPWWCQFIIIVIGSAIAWGTSVMLICNAWCN